jgi:protein-L-isoaspartate(D-aspartate) O-methyltransferase
MVDSQVRPNDVTDLRLQLALEAVPREAFLPAAIRDQAYIERELAYAPGRRLLTARDFAKLVAALEIKPDDVALDIACGTGYSTAVLAALSRKVVAIESDEGLRKTARETLAALRVDNAEVVPGDAAGGAAALGPFDVVFIGAGIAVEPERLFAQLKDGGRLAAIKVEDGVGRGVIYLRRDGVIGARAAFDAATAFVLPGFEAPRRFSF